MVKNTIKIFFINLMIQQILSSPFYLTSSSSDPSHITDFRDQPKADSRANKPDTFTDFDFDFDNDDSTTQRPFLSRRDIYVEIIGTLFRNVRMRITNAFENLLQTQQQRQQQQQLRQQPEHLKYKMLNKVEATNRKDDDVILRVNSESERGNLMKSSKLKLENDDDVDVENVDEVTTEFVGLKLDDDLNDDKITFDIEDNTNGNGGGGGGGGNNNPAYILSILRAFGLNRNHYNKTNLIGQNLENKMKIISTYILNPLIDVWNRKMNITETNNEMQQQNAKLIFQNVFTKYSNLMTNINRNSPEETEDFKTEDVDNDDDDDDDDEETDKSRTMMDGESAGIAILEFFGTILALSWGAFSQLQTIFMRN